MSEMALADRLRALERQRLRSLVEADMSQAEVLHAHDFELVHPSGGVWSRREYLGGIASGAIAYRRFDVVSRIEVLVGGELAVLRYTSLIDICVQPNEPGSLQCRHLDCYQRDDGVWRARWSQATEIAVD